MNFDFQKQVDKWKEDRKKRFEICHACEFWGRTTFGWIGCKKCNCTQAKQALGFSHCPIGKW